MSARHRPALPRRRRALTALLSAAALVGAAALGAIGSKAVDAGEKLVNAPDITVAEQVNYDFPNKDGPTKAPQLYLFPPRVPVADIAPSSIPSFAKKAGATAAYHQQIRLTISSTDDASPVLLEELVVAVVKSGAPYRGWYHNTIPPDCGGEAIDSFDVSIDLDSRGADPQIDYDSWPTAPHDTSGYDDNGKLAVLAATKASPVILDVSASPGLHSFTWTLGVRYLQSGKEHLRMLRADPLKTTGLVAGYASEYSGLVRSSSSPTEGGEVIPNPC